jgi:hypothetical protein
MTDLSTIRMTGNDTGTIPSPWKVLIFVSLAGTLFAIVALTIAIVVASRVSAVEKRPTPCLVDFSSPACAKDAQRIIRGCLADPQCTAAMAGIGPKLRRDERTQGGDGSSGSAPHSTPGGGPTTASPGPSNPPPPSQPGPRPSPPANPGPGPSPSPPPTPSPAPAPQPNPSPSPQPGGGQADACVKNPQLSICTSVGLPPLP